MLQCNVATYIFIRVDNDKYVGLDRCGISIILHDYLRRTEASMPEGSGLLQEADSLGRSAHIL